MKRDMDIVRKILLHAADAQDAIDAVPDCPPDVFAYHAYLLIDGGFVEGDVAIGPNMHPSHACIFRIRWTGQEFIDSARSDTVWRIAKEKVLRPGASWTFTLLSEVLRAIAKQQLTQAGIPGLE
jgi:hypothetical protein